MFHAAGPGSAARARDRARRPGWRLARLLPALALALTACRATPLALPTATAPSTATINIHVDGKTLAFTVPAGLTVREALARAGVSVGELDRLVPAPYTLAGDGQEITVTRITEAFETQTSVLPYTSQTVRNEGLAEGERRLLQAGQNGQEELTYRTVFEDGVQVSHSLVKRLVLTPATPEVIMIGSQGSFTLVPISGTLAYLNGRNAWVMRGNSGQRFPLTTAGDLDGFVFDLSPDGQWLLYTRAVTQTNAPHFNTLWAIPTSFTTTTAITRTASVTRTNPLAISLPISDVLYAEWSPVTPHTFAYSTGEKIARAPGWQANNDLWLMRWDQLRDRRYVYTPTLLLDSSSGGLYGWWGTGYAFAPSGNRIAYARTDSIGLVDFSVYTKTYTATVSTSELAQFTAYNTHSDWAWFPTLHWSAGGDFLYTVTHGPPIGLEAPEDSPAFNVTVLSVPDGRRYSLIPRAGMFANPVPARVSPAASGDTARPIAFMQAADPNNSPFSTYRLGLMDRDGSNVAFIFPPQDQPGLPSNETAAWSPDARRMVVAYEGNLWLIDVISGLTQQLTGDGLSAHPHWGP